MYQSRFFLDTDQKTSEFIFSLPETWWSRFYEYEWIKNFSNNKQTVLDAACGISHPLKFYLEGVCESVYACDIDPRILSKSEVSSEIKYDYGLTTLDHS